MTFGSFAEGVVSMALPCSWALAVPPALAVLAGKGRRPVAAAALVGTVVGMMVRATGQGVLDGWATIPAGVLVVTAFIALGHPGRWVPPMAALAISWTAASIWQPCVGLHLGEILNTGVEHPIRAAVSMISYAIGVSLTIPAIQFVSELMPTRVRAQSARAATGIGAALGLALSVGAHTSVIALFARWSVELSG